MVNFITKIFKNFNAVNLKQAIHKNKLIVPETGLKMPKALQSDTFKPPFSAEEIQQAVREYQKSSYINYYLREKMPLSEKCQELYNKLMYAIKTSKPLEKRIVTYRGLTLNPKKQTGIDEMLNNNSGFTSVTEDIRLAKCFSSAKNGAVVKIEFPKGFKLLKAPSEYIAPPSTKFTKAVFNPTENCWETRAISSI